MIFSYSNVKVYVNEVTLINSFGACREEHQEPYNSGM